MSRFSILFHPKIQNIFSPASSFLKNACCYVVEYLSKEQLEFAISNSVILILSLIICSISIVSILDKIVPCFTKLLWKYKTIIFGLTFESVLSILVADIIYRFLHPETFKIFDYVDIMLDPCLIPSVIIYSIVTCIGLHKAKIYPFIESTKRTTFALLLESFGAYITFYLWMYAGKSIALEIVSIIFGAITFQGLGLIFGLSLFHLLGLYSAITANIIRRQSYVFGEKIIPILKIYVVPCCLSILLLAKHTLVTVFTVAVGPSWNFLRDVILMATQAGLNLLGRSVTLFKFARNVFIVTYWNVLLPALIGLRYVVIRLLHQASTLGPLLFSECLLPGWNGLYWLACEIMNILYFLSVLLYGELVLPCCKVLAHLATDVQETVYIAVLVPEWDSMCIVFNKFEYRATHFIGWLTQTVLRPIMQCLWQLAEQALHVACRAILLIWRKAAYPLLQFGWKFFFGGLVTTMGLLFLHNAMLTADLAEERTWLAASTLALGAYTNFVVGALILSKTVQDSSVRRKIVDVALHCYRHLDFGLLGPVSHVCTMLDSIFRRTTGSVLKKLGLAWRALFDSLDLVTRALVEAICSGVVSVTDFLWTRVVSPMQRRVVQGALVVWESPYLALALSAVVVAMAYQFHSHRTSAHAAILARLSWPIFGHLAALFPSGGSTVSHVPIAAWTSVATALKTLVHLHAGDGALKSVSASSMQELTEWADVAYRSSLFFLCSKPTFGLTVYCGNVLGLAMLRYFRLRYDNQAIVAARSLTKAVYYPLLLLKVQHLASTALVRLFRHNSATRLIGSGLQVMLLLAFGVGILAAAINHIRHEGRLLNGFRVSRRQGSGGSSSDRKPRQADLIGLLRQAPQPSLLYDEPLCSICLEAFPSTPLVKESNDSLVLPCGHKFHEVCVSQWLVKATSCPTCRERLNVTGLFGLAHEIFL